MFTTQENNPNAKNVELSKWDIINKQPDLLLPWFYESVSCMWRSGSLLDKFVLLPDYCRLLKTLTWEDPLSLTELC